MPSGQRSLHTIWSFENDGTTDTGHGLFAPLQERAIREQPVGEVALLVMLAKDWAGSFVGECAACKHLRRLIVSAEAEGAP